MSFLSATDSFPSHGASLESEKDPVEKYGFEWIVDNFSAMDLPFGVGLASESFGDDSTNEYPRWDIELYPKGFKNNGWLEAKLRYLSLNRKPLFCIASISVMNSFAPYPFNVVENKMFFDYKSSSMHFLMLAKRDMVAEIKKWCFLSDDALTLVCKVRAYTERALNNEGYIENVFTLFDGKKHADLILKTRGRDFRVHKVILAARSTVFKDILLKLSVKSDNSLQVLRVDFESAVAEKLLQYMYTGQCFGLVDHQTIVSLYEAARDCGLPELMAHCLDVLKRGLNVDNVCSTLIFAHRAGEEELEIFANDFMNSVS